MELGRYRLLRQLAIGGMAEVYLAHANGIERFQKLVVLKRILPQHASEPSFVQMFLDEARLLAMLHHPNIVQVFDIGAQIGNYYFAMEYVHGRDVREILCQAARTRKRIPLGVAISIAQGVCRGLHYAHERADNAGQPLGIVHRDVSPSNVQVTYDGGVKLLDFGVAKASVHERQTQAGAIKGKISYMSPEQCFGLPLDARSDVFAIGILLFEMTTGTRLFKGASDLDILTKIAHFDAPSPATRRPDYPPELERIVIKALARDVAQRYQTAQQLERDLVQFARDERLATSAIDVADVMALLFPDAVREPTPVPRSRPRSLVDRDDEPSVLILDGFDDEPRPRPRALTPADLCDVSDAITTSGEVEQCTSPADSPEVGSVVELAPQLEPSEVRELAPELEPSEVRALAPELEPSEVMSVGQRLEHNEWAEVLQRAPEPPTAVVAGLQLSRPPSATDPLYQALTARLPRRPRVAAGLLGGVVAGLSLLMFGGSGQGGAVSAEQVPSEASAHPASGPAVVDGTDDESGSRLPPLGAAAEVQAPDSAGVASVQTIEPSADADDAAESSSPEAPSENRRRTVAAPPPSAAETLEVPEAPARPTPALQQARARPTAQPHPKPKARAKPKPRAKSTGKAPAREQWNPDSPLLPGM